MGEVNSAVCEAESVFPDGYTGRPRARNRMALGSSLESARTWSPGRDQAGVRSESTEAFYEEYPR